MGQATSQIEAHIEETRTDLGSNLQELEQKVKSVTDWKQHFQKNPMTAIGRGLWRGRLLATMLGGGKSRRRERRFSDPTILNRTEERTIKSTGPGNLGQH